MSGLPGTLDYPRPKQRWHSFELPRRAAEGGSRVLSPPFPVGPVTLGTIRSGASRAAQREKEAPMDTRQLAPTSQRSNLFEA